MNIRLPSFYLLAVFCTLSMLELTGVQAAILFFLIALILGALTHRKDVMISPVAFIIVSYALAFPLPMLFPGLYPHIWNNVSPQTLEYGMLWALRGFGAFAFGYVLFAQIGKRVRKRNLRDAAFYSARMRYTVYVMTCIGWLAILSWLATVMTFGIGIVFIEGDMIAVDTESGALLQIFTALSSLRYPFILGFLVMYYWKHSSMQLNFLMVGILIISFVNIISTGSKGEIIRILMVFLLAQTFLPVRWSIKQVIIGVLALIAVYGSFTVITEYRSIMQGKLMAGDDVFSFEVQLNSFGKAVNSSLPYFGDDADRQTGVKQTDVLNRFGSGMFSFANMMEFTGRQPPFENAMESFLVPIYSVAPRILIPEKPVFFGSGHNAQMYYGLSYGGISVTLLGSFYYALGYAGIIFGMMFFGGLLAYVTRQARLGGIYSPHWLILLVVLMVMLMDVGQSFQDVATNFIRVAVILWLLHLLYPLVRGLMWRKISRFSGPIQRGSRA